jgi:hypothetical protein
VTGGFFWKFGSKVFSPVTCWMKLLLWGLLQMISFAGVSISVGVVNPVTSIGLTD